MLLPHPFHKTEQQQLELQLKKPAFYDEGDMYLVEKLRSNSDVVAGGC